MHLKKIIATNNIPHKIIAPDACLIYKPPQYESNPQNKQPRSHKNLQYDYNYSFYYCYYYSVQSTTRHCTQQGQFQLVPA